MLVIVRLNTERYLDPVYDAHSQLANVPIILAHCAAFYTAGLLPATRHAGLASAGTSKVPTSTFVSPVKGLQALTVRALGQGYALVRHIGGWGSGSQT